MKSKGGDYMKEFMFVVIYVIISLVILGPEV
jgi:hypothetical protein